jgi:hypothetical protein
VGQINDRPEVLLSRNREVRCDLDHTKRAGRCPTARTVAVTALDSLAYQPPRFQAILDQYLSKVRDGSSVGGRTAFQSIL